MILNLLLLLCVPFFAIGYEGEIRDFWRYWTQNDLALDRPRSPWSALIGLTLLNFLIALCVSTFLSSNVTSTTNVSALPYAFLVLVMIVEELIFRGIPLVLGWIVKKITKIELYILFGYVSSFIFGYLHIFNFKQPVPFYAVLPQTVGGFIFFWMGRRFGFGYAILAHVLYNSVLFGLGVLMHAFV